MWRVVKRDPETFWQIEELWQAAIAAQIVEEEER